MPGEDKLVTAAIGVLSSRTSRRSFLVRLAVAGSALTVAPLRYLLRPGDALAACASCTPGPQCNCSDLCCSDTNSVYCCTLTGSNDCASGSGRCGWWYCSATGIAYVDCCKSCTDGCRCGNDNCNNRRSCCNNSYGNCSGTSNTKVYCRITRRENPPTNCSGTPTDWCPSMPACAQV